MAMDGEIKVYNVFSSKSVGTGATVKSDPIDLSLRARNGNLGLQYYITSDGSPAIDIKYELSIDGSNYVTPGSGANLATGLTKASGTSGRDVLDITAEIEFAKWMKLVLTETASDATGATVTLDLAMQ